ncbi:MAG: hypothetical protein AAFW60_02830 [Pseudomonadota bacterium]
MAVMPNFVVADHLRDRFFSGDCLVIEEFEWRGRKDYRTRIAHKDKVWRAAVVDGNTVYVTAAGLREHKQRMQQMADAFFADFEHDVINTLMGV